MTAEPRQTWWTAAELEAAGLPDLPTTKRRINALAGAKGWASIPGKARRRKGRGGGTEYHWTVLPERARTALLEARAPQADVPDAPRPREDAWADFEALPDKHQATARDRLALIAEIEALEAAGLTRSAAVRSVAAQRKPSEKTLWNWLDLIDGVAVEDRLAYLAPRYRGSTARRVEIDPRFWALFTSDYHRDKAICFQVAYEHACEAAVNEGITDIPPLYTCRRRYHQTVPREHTVLLREGLYALQRYYPHQERSRQALSAMDAVQADYHKLDVFVTWPGEDTPQRPQIVVFSDIYSGKMLAWRMSLHPNAETVRLCFGDVVSRYGIPRHALMDNGHEFAAKTLTGGAKNRYRFTKQAEDMLGLMPDLGIEVHFAKPAWGQAKPIEGAFRDLTNRIPTHPALDGAQTGNDPRNKPKNYGQKPADPETVAMVVQKVIEAHNARPDRRTETAFGRSFDDVFAESYAKARIRKATEAQKRLWLLAAEPVRAAQGNGLVKLYGNRFWSDWMYRIAGERIVARYDPDNLHAGVHIYGLDGAYHGEAAIVERGDFFSKEDAQTHNRKRSQWVKATKKAAKLHQQLSAAEIAARLSTPDGRVSPDALPQAEVVELVTPQRRGAPSADTWAAVSNLDDHRPAETGDEADAIYARARDLEALRDGGTALTEDQSSWLENVQASPAYKARQRLDAAFGKR